MYDTQTPGGRKLSIAVAKVREGLAEIERLKSSTLAKAYEDRPGGTGDPVFTRMVEEYGVADAADGQALFTDMDTVVLAYASNVNAPASEALLQLDSFA